LLLLLLACFGSVLLRDGQFGFRDAGHYYYPLHLRVQQEWEAGRWPLWAQEANGGTPLLGNPTAAVLYPGKVVFFLLPYPWAAKLYVIGHVVLAFATAWAMLRGWGVSTTGATLGAFSYAFGAPVLSQTCNVIFLVGAAWVPLGFLAADRWLRLGRRRALPALTLVLAMQVLGGDPEAAYVTVLCVSAYALGLAARRAPTVWGRWLRRAAIGLIPATLGLLALSWWSARATQAAEAARPDDPAPWRPPTGLLVLSAWGLAAAFVVRRARRGGETGELVSMVGGLAGAASLALAITGAQLLPVLESSHQSYRAIESEGFHNIYPFSVHPLQLVGAVWPDVYGTTDRGNRWWGVALPPKHEDSLWMRSVYLGGLTLVLTSAGIGLRDGPPWRAWLTGVAFVSLLAALGSYASPVLWARCVPGWSSALGPLDPPVVTRVRTDGLLQDGDGGVYWLLASALPGFRVFRYPPKLLVFTALAVSGLAGVGWDRLVEGTSRRALRIASGLLALSLLALGAIWIGGGALRDAFRSLAQISGSGYGPLEIEGAVADLRAAFVQGGAAYALAVWVAARASRRPGLAGGVAVALLAIDLGLAGSRQVIAVRQSVFEGTPRVLEVIRAAEQRQPSPGPFRVQRVGVWWSDAWYEQSDPHRDEEIIRWERETIRPNYQMPLGVRMTFAFDTTAIVDHASMLFPWRLLLNEEAARGPGLKPGQKIYYYPRRGYDLWNTRYFVVPSYLTWDDLERGYGSFVPGTTQIDPPPGAFSGPDGPARRKRWEREDDVRVLRNESAYPRAWVVHRARVLPPLDGSVPARRRALNDEILYQNDALWRDPGRSVRDPRLMAWVETDQPRTLDPFLSRAVPSPSETVTVIRDDNPQHVELTAVLETPGLVVVADVFYPGWTLTVDGRPAEILRTNRAMRGVALPAGTHHLVFRYEPLSFRIGLGLSIVGLVALGSLTAWGFRQRAPGPHTGESGERTSSRSASFFKSPPGPRSWEAEAGRS
jgi:hypothetical protein